MTAEWAEDFHGVWHRMSTRAWDRGVGPAAPVACCGRRIESVHHSMFDPRTLDDGTEHLCGVPTRAITVRQPWATLIAEGVKTIETRGRRDPWRSAIGETVAIHAAKRAPVQARIGDWWCEPTWGKEYGLLDESGTPRRVPLGAVVATARIADVVPIGPLSPERDRATAGFVVYSHSPPAREMLLRYPTGGGPPIDVLGQLPYGDFTPGGWAVLLEDVRKTAPAPCRGAQGLWTVPAAVADNLLGWAA